MAKREQFDAPIECSKCGRKGRATFSEYENSVYAGGSLDTRLVDVPTGFIKKDSEIHCIECGIAVETI